MKLSKPAEIEVLICTCNGGLNGILSRLPLSQSGVRYLVSHQIFGTENSVIATDTAARDLENRTDVTLVTVESRGLSNNRNNALVHATGEILLIADDDAVFESDFADSLKAAFAIRKNADVVTFRIRTPEGILFKKYYADGHVHTRKSLFRVSSVEVALRRKSLIASGVLFDVNFGLNAEFPCGEETVLLADLMHFGLTAVNCDSVIAVHPRESSGRNYIAEGACRVRGAVIRRVYGMQGMPLVVAYAIKHHAEYKHYRSFIDFCKLALQGFFSIKSMRK